jgi:ubiquitin
MEQRIVEQRGEEIKKLEKEGSRLYKSTLIARRLVYLLKVKIRLIKASIRTRRLTSLKKKLIHKHKKIKENKKNGEQAGLKKYLPHLHDIEALKKHGFKIEKHNPQTKEKEIIFLKNGQKKN